MDGVSFRREMLRFAELRNIPLFDVLHDIDETILFVTAQEEDKEALLAQAFSVYCRGFPTALPPGTTSVRRRQAKLDEEDDN